MEMSVLLTLQGFLHLVDESFASEIAEDGAVAVDEEELREGGESVEFGNAVIGGVQHVWVRQVHGIEPRQMVLGIVEGSNAHNDQPLVGVFLVQRFQVFRDFLSARVAPGGPEIHHRHMAFDEL